MTTYVQTGKIGDVLSLLPLLQHVSSRDREKVNLVISKQYAHVVSGLDYINPVIWNGDWQNLAGAVMFAKERFVKVIVPQTYGKSIAIEHKTPSFQYDQWLRAGGLSLWDQLPLNIPRTEHGKEIAARYVGGKTILVADQGESSQFEHIEQLIGRLRQEFEPGYMVVRLSEIVLDRFTDFVHIYDAADAVIVTETSHLHLAKATKTPVFAFVTDRPQRWHGSAYSRSHVMHIRYSQYQRREQEFIETLKDTLNGVGRPQAVQFKTDEPNGYNLSICQHGESTLYSYRYHPDPNQWRTKIKIYDLATGREGTLRLPGIYTNMSHEDARFFRYNGCTYMSLVVAVYPGTPGLTTPCSMVYGEVERFADGWYMREVRMPEYDRNGFQSQQKNWVFFEHDNRLYFIFQCSPEQIVCRLAKDGVTVDEVYRTKSPSWSHGEIRGGTQPLIVPRSGGGNGWLRFFHSLHKHGSNRNAWSYYIGALIMESEPPFQIRQISKWPVFSGNEEYVPGWNFFKAAVAIPYGAINKDDHWLLTVGLNDSKCATIEVNERQLNL